MKDRVLCGGSFSNLTRSLRTADCVKGVPEGRYWFVGFRLVIIRRKK